MGNQTAGDDSVKPDPVDGDVRFGSAGRLETFDGADWVPLERVSDTGTPAIFRHIPSTPRDVEPTPPGRDEPGSPDDPAPS